MKKKLKVISIGASGFPFYKSATVNKSIFFSKVFKEAECDVLVISNEALFIRSIDGNIPLKGLYKGIRYKYTLKTPYMAASPIMRVLSRFLGLFNEFFFLIQYKLNKGIDICIFYTNGSFLRLIYYRLLSLMLNFKFILVYHEYRSDFESRQNNLFKNINDKLFDKYFLYFIDAVMPISEFLISHIKSINATKPLLKIPPLIDFNLFSKPKTNSESYFLYCGSIEYKDIITFIIDSFGQIQITHNFLLYLVVGGNQNQLKEIVQFVEDSPFCNNIKILSNLSYDDLISLYINAKALLIPLRPSIRDEARSPQKIAEYVASGNPMISTNYGEIKYYFKDEKNALIAKDFDVVSFSKKMEYVIEKPKKAIEIGIAGKKTGMQYFNYLNYTDKIKILINQLHL